MMQNCFRFKNPILLMALAAAYPVVGYAVPAARIDFAAGPVTAVSATGVQRPLTKGAEISSGDTIRTGNDGRAQLRFTDGAMISLQPQTEFRIDDYNYSGRNDGQEKGFFNLLRGGLRTITGLIGKGNRDAYRVTTQVATIGIRGTEYSATYTSASNDALIVHTGEGRIEVCNAGGCAIVVNGESALVTGRNQAPARTENRPLLQPAQPVTTEIVVTATGETKTSTGTIAPISTPLPSGPAQVAFVGYSNGSQSGPAVFSTTVSMGPNSELLSFEEFGTLKAAGTIAGAFSMDGVIGWGRWVDGTETGCFSVAQLKDYHYVVGSPTPSADITALQAANITATYHLAGFTLPTSDTGVVGQAPSGDLTAHFMPGCTSINLSMSIPIGGGVVPLNGSGMMFSGSPTFSLFAGCGSYVSGFFAGANASHAGLTYSIDTSGAAFGNRVNGAAVFKR